MHHLLLAGSLPFAAGLLAAPGVLRTGVLPVLPGLRKTRLELPFGGAHLVAGLSLYLVGTRPARPVGRLEQCTARFPRVPGLELIFVVARPGLELISVVARPPTRIVGRIELPAAPLPQVSGLEPPLVGAPLGLELIFGVARPPPLMRLPLGVSLHLMAVPNPGHKLRACP